MLLFDAVIFSARFIGPEIKKWEKFILSVFIFFFLQVFLSQIFLGIFGLLTYSNLLILNLLIFLAFFFLRPKKISFPDLPKFEPYTLIVLGPFLILFLLRYFYALFQVPLEYDTISYHLPFVVEWYNTGSLLGIYYSVFAGPLGYYPSNFELFELWALIPFGKDILINFLNFPIIFILILGLYSILKNLNISAKSAWLGIAFLIYMPIFCNYLGFPHVDVFFTTLFILAIYFLQECWRTKNIFDIAMTGIALGMFIGTKYIAIPFSIPLLVLALIIIFRNYRKNKKSFFSALGLFTSGGILGGAFWFIRNWIDSGNPIFPTEVSILGHNILSGYYGLTDRIFEYSLAYNIKGIAEFKDFFLNFFERAGIQAFIIPIFAGILFLYMLFVFIKTFFVNQTKKQFLIKDFFISGLIILALIFYFYIYWIAPYSYIALLPNIRYAMMFFVFASVMVALLVDRIKVLEILMYAFFPSAVFYNIALLIIQNPNVKLIEGDRIPLDYLFILKNPEYFFIFIFWFLLLLTSLYLLIKLLASEKKTILLKLTSFSSLVFFLITSLYLFTQTAQKREELKVYFYEQYYAIEPLGTLSIVNIVNWFDKHDNNAKIAYAGSPFHYHFFGRDLQREVDYININECSDCRYIDYKDSPESVRRDPDFESWLNNLKVKSKVYLIVAPTISTDIKSWEFEWAQAHPEHFEEVLKQDSIYVYKISY